MKNKLRILIVLAVALFLLGCAIPSMQGTQAPPQPPPPALNITQNDSLANNTPVASGNETANKTSPANVTIIWPIAKKTNYTIILSDVIFERPAGFYATFEESDAVGTAKLVQVKSGAVKKLPLSSELLTVRSVSPGTLGPGVWAKVILSGETQERTVFLNKVFSMNKYLGKYKLRLVDVAYPSARASIRLEPKFGNAVYANMSAGEKLAVPVSEASDAILTLDEVNAGYLNSSNWVRISSSRCGGCSDIFKLGERSDAKALGLGSPTYITLTKLKPLGSTSAGVPYAASLEVLDRSGNLAAMDTLATGHTYALPDGFMFRLNSIAKSGSNYVADISYYGNGQRIQIGEQFSFG